MPIASTFNAADGSICLISDIQARLGLAAGVDDAVILAIIQGVEGLFVDYCGRQLVMTTEAVTEDYTGMGPYLQLKRFPVIAISSVIEAVDWAFATTEPLTADLDYRLVNSGVRGMLWRAWGQSWCGGPDSVRVTYRGGYCPAGQTPASGETAMPAALREAAIEQGSFIYKRRDDIGLISVGFEGGNFSKKTEIDLLPQVVTILDQYRLKRF